MLGEFEHLEQEFTAISPHPLCGREQLNVGMIEAGDYVNRLPTPIRVMGTWRWMPGKTQEQIRAALQLLCDRLSAKSRLAFGFSLEATREPFETPVDDPVVQAFDSAARRVAGRAPERIGMALVGDANLFANEAGVPTIYYGPAQQTAPSDYERVSARQLAHCAKVYALAAIEYCGLAV